MKIKETKAKKMNERVMMKQNTYVAFLRGINVGGKVIIQMAKLKDEFVELGFRNVRTVLASGNVIFTSSKSRTVLSEIIETELQKRMNRDIHVIIRSKEEIDELLSSYPFQSISLTENIRLYVTFLKGVKNPKTISIPYCSSDGEFQILQFSDLDIISALDLSKGKGTVDLMKVLDNEFGSELTTRNWNTLLKIGKALND